MGVVQQRIVKKKMIIKKTSIVFKPTLNIHEILNKHRVLPFFLVLNRNYDLVNCSKQAVKFFWKLKQLWKGSARRESVFFTKVYNATTLINNNSLLNFRNEFFTKKKKTGRFLMLVMIFRYIRWLGRWYSGACLRWDFGRQSQITSSKSQTEVWQSLDR